MNEHMLLVVSCCVDSTNTTACDIDGGYESDSEEGQDEGEGQTEVTNDAAHCFREHTGSVGT